MALIYSVDPSLATVVGLDRVLIDLTNWGNISPSQDPNNGSVLQQLNAVSFCGMCIAPDSVVDEVLLRVGELRQGVGGQARGFQWRLSPESPYVGELPSAIQVVSMTDWADLYTPLEHDTGPFNVARFHNLVPPTLKLIAWLRADTVVPTKRIRVRMSTWRSRVGGFVDIPAGPDLVELVTWPVWGRKKCRVSFKVRGPAGSAVELNVTGLPNAGDSGSVTRQPQYGLEQLLAGPVVVPSDSQHTFVIDPLYVSFLMPKAKYVSGTPSVWAEMEAVD